MAGRFFGIPFALSGDRVVTPDATQPDGSASFTEGFTFDYELPNTDPDYKPVPRDGTNGLFHDITEALGIIQRQGFADWTIAATPYAIKAYVRHAGTVWRSLIINNSDEPGMTANWVDVTAAVAAATTVIAGITRYATSAETIAGVVTDAAVTPAGLAAALAETTRVIHVRDQKAAGTNGGTFTNGAWRTRDLNTVLANTIAGASLAANRVTLPAGTYETFASAPSVDTSGHQARLYNITGAATLINGTTAFNSGAGTSAASLVQGRFTLGVTSDIELQHACQTTAATTGFGVGNTLVGQKAFEVYADLFIRKVA